ncbi:hypothetical protein [Kitasatospora sp. GAS204B]|uniref:hypothetical protein n=1 Tax=unclassified Kitasatospora TaxID=2633591 RepID=UPI0024733018|nr:hypothetical protein [Kitasatospora sp. GAS204B]MDH6118888.1 cell division septal protein FtsQ [Kitasatospora sp. GAS204B]
MSRRRSRRGRGSARSRSRRTGSLLHHLLSKPARRNVRWRFIATVMVVTTGLYLQVMLTAPPMPPSKAPVPGSSSVAPQPADDQNT